MLELRIAGRDFGQPVLGEIFVGIERGGDRICLMGGPSGIGKTTLLNAIAGLDKAIPESAVLGGREVLRVGGYLFQEHRLLPWKSLMSNLRLVGASKREAEELLMQVGLAGYGGAYLPDQLSLGMARRAAWRDAWLLNRTCCCWTSRLPRWIRSWSRNSKRWSPGFWTRSRIWR